MGLLLPAGARAGTAPPRTAPPRGGGAGVIRLGLVADVQYADKEAAGKRRYRDSLESLRACVRDWQGGRLDFAVNLGDLIDGHGAASEAELERVAALFRPLRCPVRHVVGNHCLAAGRPALGGGLKLPRAGYYEFRRGEWRFLALDTMEISVESPPGSPGRAAAQAYRDRDPTLATYNGAVGPRQLAWLQRRLERARREGARVAIFSHHPLFAPPAGTAGYTPWNGPEVAAVIASAGCVAVCFAGHDHAGGYAQYGSIHQVILQGMVEVPPGHNAYAVVEMQPDRVVVHGVGDVPSRTLSLAPQPVRAP